MKTQRTAACTGSIERYWAPRELVMVGVFAAAAKLSSLLIALAGGEVIGEGEEVRVLKIEGVKLIVEKV